MNARHFAPSPERRGRPAIPYYLTAKAYRALGYTIPTRVPDDAVVDLIVEEAPRVG